MFWNTYFFIFTRFHVTTGIFYNTHFLSCGQVWGVDLHPLLSATAAKSFFIDVCPWQFKYILNDLLVYITVQNRVPKLCTNSDVASQILTFGGSNWNINIKYIIAVGAWNLNMFLSHAKRQRIVELGKGVPLFFRKDDEAYVIGWRGSRVNI